ncbi:CBS domain-containing protein [Litoreibacter roseus]|uniref:CBS domain-containing protein n=1 Tax=Litoreibacter roseus TaxID=2601869 RepID=A0A6N6JJ18_9RHOB|nr:CBS domain-containing protein [Litoreibacter roseus]GFE66363.1 hypothetical protein KIN_34370 [Litoreibacter roseus]
MTQDTERPGNRLKDRPEYASKSKPLTRGPDDSVLEAVAAMSDKNYGCVIIVDPADQVIGVVTERDIMNKLVAKGLDASKTKLRDLMTENPRLAREEDDFVDWLRMMSNERFRRLPVVDGDGKIKAVFTQGDFVSYTWPDLMYQMGQMAKASVAKNFHYYLIGGGLLIYTVAILIVLRSI